MGILLTAVIVLIFIAIVLSLFVYRRRSRSEIKKIIEPDEPATVESWTMGTGNGNSSDGSDSE